MTFKELLDTNPREDFAERIKEMTREELERKCLWLWDREVAICKAIGGDHVELYEELLPNDRRAIDEGIKEYKEACGDKDEEGRPLDEPVVVSFQRYLPYSSEALVDFEALVYFLSGAVIEIES